MNDDHIIYENFLKSFELVGIDPFFLSSRKIQAEKADTKIEINWQQSLADGDPEQLEEQILLFRFKVEAIAVQEDSPFFQQTSEFALKFKANDFGLYESVMANPVLKKSFLHNQLTMTIWPIFRQQTLDGMSRVGLKTITLPWLFKKI